MELLVVISAGLAVCVTAVGYTVVWIIRVYRVLVVRDAIRGCPYGLLCSYCDHRLDMMRRATRVAYKAGVCPMCGHALFRM